MSTSLDIMGLLPLTPTPEPTPPPNPTSEPTSEQQFTRPQEFTPSRYPKILLDHHGRPAGYLHTTGRAPTTVQIDEAGIIWCGDEIVAHYTDTGLIRPAMEMPAEATPETINRIAEALLLSSTYTYNDTLHVATEAEGVHRIRPLHTFPAFDAHMSASIAFVKVKTTKDNVSFTVMPLEGRIALSIFASASLKEHLPQIVAQNPVSLPYHPANDRRVVRWNPPGYNPETMTFTRGEASAIDLSDRKTCNARLMLRWHRRLTHEYLWATPADYHAYLAQTLAPYCTELLTKTNPDGTSARALIAASLIESDSTEGASGKSTLTQLALLGPYGKVIGEIPQTKEEVQAHLVATLLAGGRAIFLDEAKQSLVDCLLTAISDNAGGRVKGQSLLVHGKLHISLAAAKPSFSSMLSRRILSCKVNTRPKFLNMKFKRFITEFTIGDYRSAMLSLCQEMVNRWSNQGCPLAEPNSQWPEYSALVGGILVANGVPNPMHTKIAALSYNDNDHIDSQWGDYFKLVASGELTFGLESAEPTPTEGCYAAVDVLRWAKSAGFYHQIKEDAAGVRTFLNTLSSWTDVGNPIYGYNLSKKRKNTGNHIIFKKVVDEPTP